MDYLGENRYQLLFIDDDDTDDSDKQSIGQPTAVGQQLKNKRNKNKNVITAGSNQKLNEKPSQQQQQQQQLVEQQQETPQQQQQTPPPRSSPDKDKLQQQQQLQQQLQQQQHQQQQQQQQQSQPPPFRYRQRIINNSNRFNAAGYGGGGGVGGGGYRGNSTRNMKTNDSNNHEQQQQLQAEDNSKYMTVEQWNAMRGERAKPTYNIRQPGEGEPSKPHWQQMVKLQQKKSPLPPSVAKSDEDNNNGIDCDASMYPQRVGRLQRVVDIEFKFKDDRRRNAAYRSGWMLARPLNTQARIQTLTKTQTQSHLQLESNFNPNNNKNNNNSFNNYESETALDPINMNDEAEFPTLG